MRLDPKMVEKSAHKRHSSCSQRKTMNYWGEWEDGCVHQEVDT